MESAGLGIVVRIDGGPVLGLVCRQWPLLSAATLNDRQRQWESSMRNGALFLFLISITLSGSAEALDWRHYQNARFGTSADVPAGFTVMPPPENDDGQGFEGAGGGRISVYGAFDFTSGFAEYRAFLKQTLEDEGWSLTYTPSGENWFVLSGVSNGQILYQRVERPAGCTGDILHHIEFRYPAEDKSEWKPIVERGAKTLTGPCG
jgi:hypothetical protein